MVPLFIAQVKGKEAVDLGIQEDRVFVHGKWLPNLEFPIGAQHPGIEARVKDIGARVLDVGQSRTGCCQGNQLGIGHAGPESTLVVLRGLAEPVNIAEVHRRTRRDGFAHDRVNTAHRVAR